MSVHHDHLHDPLHGHAHDHDQRSGQTLMQTSGLFRVAGAMLVLLPLWAAILFVVLP